jgi:hypothetical protein
MNCISNAIKVGLVLGGLLTAGCMAEPTELATKRGVKAPTLNWLDLNLPKDFVADFRRTPEFKVFAESGTIDPKTTLEIRLMDGSLRFAGPATAIQKFGYEVSGPYAMKQVQVIVSSSDDKTPHVVTLGADKTFRFTIPGRKDK